MKFELLVIALLAGSVSLTAAYATFIQDNTNNCVYFDDYAIGFCKTNASGSAPGNFANFRGFDGVIFSSAGTGSYGTGVAGMRLNSNADLSMTNAKSIVWEDAGISITRTDTTGTTVGTFLQLRGFDGIVFRTGGTGFFGTGNEAMRINSNGDLVMTGNIVGAGSGDLCLGNCP